MQGTAGSASSKSALQFTSKANETGSDLAAENERLKARVAELEAQLAAKS